MSTGSAFGPAAARSAAQGGRHDREPSGKALYLDAEFDLPDGTVLAVEIDGAAHLQPESWWDDSARQNEVVIAGRPMLRFPSLTVRLDGPAVVDQLRRMRLAHAA